MAVMIYICLQKSIDRVTLIGRRIVKLNKTCTILL